MNLLSLGQHGLKLDGWDLLARFGFSRLGMGSGDPIDHVVQHPLHTEEAHLGMLTPNGVVTLLSDQIVVMILAALLLMIFLPLMVRKRKGSDEVGRLVPAGGANLIESVCHYLRKDMAEPLLEDYTDRFIKYIWTVFFFILTMNLLGLLPIAAISMGLFGKHIGGTPTANIWVTTTLALTTLGMLIVNGLRLGGLDYIKHFNPGPWWMAPLLVPLELVGLVAKAASLAIRLFANMVAGHILLAVLLGFIISVGSASGAAAGFAISLPVVAGSVAINLLEIFVAFLQAYIFTFLTTLFLGMSVIFHHEDHAEAHAH
ncbi:MAG: F0F1 ATP synthase subunit A [Acidobacteriota bacterium]